MSYENSCINCNAKTKLIKGGYSMGYHVEFPCCEKCMPHMIICDGCGDSHDIRTTETIETEEYGTVCRSSYMYECEDCGNKVIEGEFHLDGNGEMDDFCCSDDGKDVCYDCWNEKYREI